MGQLVNGRWRSQKRDTGKTGGEYVREAAQLRNWITTDGSPGASGEGGFVAEAGRYHLYVSLACPWAHRTLILRTLKGLEPYIDISVVSPFMREHGWTFNTEEGSSGDPLYHSDYLYQLYLRNRDDYTGRVSVPLLWDKQRTCVVNNESSEIVRMFNSAFDHLTGNHEDFYPEELRGDIDATNAVVYETVNNGVYRAGFATSQKAYEQAYEALFCTLDQLEQRLHNNRYLTGDRITEADWRLFTTLIRFDAVYHGHFKCNKQRLADYKNLWGFTRELYQWPGVAETVNFFHIKHHYYDSHRNINPTGIVPRGPELDYAAPHGRG
ncbi:glutathione S-transferase family protein [Microbulbifer spongiae]|uniref:Glutathione S-transferase family protein n=1 Tax=Microbulbifer spongiae TaxID=2944933 RepID=A0ABY9ECE1_9GAMM|nr:glutathione S-transferase family protein [Microbulbifer sp. MI-G]WKD49743.1 glutathione S-transferase family protein [Microbulbifer sp. MI-G]